MDVTKVGKLQHFFQCDATHTATAVRGADYYAYHVRCRGTAMTVVSPDPQPMSSSIGDHRGYARLGFAAIALVFGGFGIWASFAPLDRAAVAQGQVAVESSNKPVQHLEGGIVREILVHDSQQVKEGDVMFRLQPTNAQANLDILRKQIDAGLAQEARLVAEKTQTNQINFPADLLARRNIKETDLAIRDQERVFQENREKLNGELGILSSQIAQKQADIDGRQRQKE